MGLSFSFSMTIVKTSSKDRGSTWNGTYSHHFHRDLKRLEIPLNNLMHILPDNTPDSGLYVVDTSDLIGALLGDDSGNRRGLDRTCRSLQINPEYLHNAGNDAHVRFHLYSSTRRFLLTREH